jgi:hypothetical protein
MRSIRALANRGEPDFPRVIPLFAFPEDIRKVIYTTNAIESVNMTLRKVTRNHRIFPSDEAVYKVVYLAMRNIAVARGRCRSATGSRRRVALPSNLRGVFPDEQAVGRGKFPGLLELEGLRTPLCMSRSWIPAWYTDLRKIFHRIVHLGRTSLP